MPKHYPTRASLHRSDATTVDAPAVVPLVTEASPAANGPEQSTEPTTSEPAATEPASSTAKPPLLTRAERRRREQASMESTALMAPVAEPAVVEPAAAPAPQAPQPKPAADAKPAPEPCLASGPIPRPQWAPVKTGGPTAAPAPAGSAFGPVGAPARRSVVLPRETARPTAAPADAVAQPEGSAPMTRAERRRAEEAARLAADHLPAPVLPSRLPVGDDEHTVPSRSARRDAEHGSRQRRKADQRRKVHHGSLAAVTGALVVATVLVDPIAVASPSEPTDEDHLLIAEGGLELRGSAASRAGARAPLADDVVDGEPAAEVVVEKEQKVASATDALDRAATLVTTETRTSPEQREEILAKAALVRELSNLLAAGDAPAPADPELVEVVTATLTSTAQSVAEANGTYEVLEADVVDPAAEEGEADGLEPADAVVVAPEVDLKAPEVVAKALATATAQLDALLQGAEPAAAVVEARPATPAEVRAQQIEESIADRDRLLGYADSTAGFENGRIPMSALQELSWAPGHFLRIDAATQLERLNVAFYAQFGTNLSITSTYRSFEGQVRVRASRGRMAAIPGTSNHGWGVAVDLGGGINRFGTAAHRWMREHAEDFGWILPTWARERGRLPEPWHWEFEGVPASA